MAATSTLVGAGIALSAISAAMQISMAQSAAAAEKDAQHQRQQFAFDELGRQQETALEIGQEQKQDRSDAADKEIQMVRALMAEKGGLQSGNFEALVRKVGYYEGKDLGRIEGNVQREVESLQAQKRSVAISAANAVNAANRNALAASIGAGVQFGNAVLKGANTYYADKRDTTTTNKAP